MNLKALIWKQCFYALYLFVQVCIEKMQDLQLALVISRLYESEFESASTYKKILQRHVLGQDKQVPVSLTHFLDWMIGFKKPQCFESSTLR